MADNDVNAPMGETPERMKDEPRGHARTGTRQGKKLGTPPCQECGTLIEHHEARCPNCGTPTEQSSSREDKEEDEEVEQCLDHWGDEIVYPEDMCKV